MGSILAYVPVFDIMLLYYYLEIDIYGKRTKQHRKGSSKRDL